MAQWREVRALTLGPKDSMAVEVNELIAKSGVRVSALLWWLIPVGAVIIALGIGALVSYLRRPTEHHDLGKFASMQEAMNRSHGHIRVQRNSSDRD